MANVATPRRWGAFKRLRWKRVAAVGWVVIAFLVATWVALDDGLVNAAIVFGALVTALAAIREGLT